MTGPEVPLVHPGMVLALAVARDDEPRMLVQACCPCGCRLPLMVEYCRGDEGKPQQFVEVRVGDRPRV